MGGRGGYGVNMSKKDLGYKNPQKAAHVRSISLACLTEEKYMPPQ